MIEIFLIGEEHEQPQNLDLENGGLITDLTYQIIDSDNITKQLDNVTKTIKIVGNKHNNNVLGSLFNLNRVSTSTGKLGANNSLKKQVEALVYEDGNLITRGNFRIEKVTVKNGVNYYDGIITGFRASFFAQLKDSMLKDLDFSSLQHNYTLDNIHTSSGNTSGYIYPFIDYGHGIIEENLNGNGSISTWTKKNLKPALFIKEYFNRIFSSRGYSYTFIGELNNVINKLIIPCNKIALKNDSLFSFKHSSNTQLVFGIERTSTETEPYDPQYQYFPSYTTNNLFMWTSRYFFGVQKDVEMDFSGDVDVQDATVWDINPNLSTAQKNAIKVEYDANVIIYKQGIDGISDLKEIAKGYTRVNKYMTGTNNTFKVNIPYTRIKLVEGEKIRMRLLVNNVDLSAVPNNNAYSKSSSLNEGLKKVQGKSILANVAFGNDKQKNTTIEIGNGDIVDFNQFILPNIKQVDLVKNIMQMFNLICYSKIENPKHFYFSTYNDYYSKEEAENIINNNVDWSAKVDVNNYTISPLNSLAKKYKWEYSVSEDWLNKTYHDKYKEVYGTKNINTGTEYKDDEIAITSIFSPTIIPNIYSGYRYPTIFKYTDENLKEVYESELKILFIQGQRNLTTPLQLIRRIRYKDLFPSTYKIEGELLSKIAEVTTFYENVDYKFDLNFGVPYEEYDTVTVIKKNLFDLYYQKMIVKNNHNDTVMLSVNVYLNSTDIANLDLSKPVFLDLPTGSNYYKIISIDYKVNADTPSTVVLQKIIL